MSPYLSDLAKGLVGLVYPCVCEACGAKINTDTEEGCLCRDCLGQMTKTAPVNPCRYKGINIWSACIYDGAAKECVHLFKYGPRPHLARPLARLMADFLNNCVKQDGFDIIVPVPLYPSRFRQRGFNQAELLAKNVALFSGRPLAANAIKRIRPTLAQAGLSKTERFKNTRGAFKVTDAAGVCGKDVLIIDDVLTTGSTISECARALRKAGAKSISALVLAKGM